MKYIFALLLLFSTVTYAHSANPTIKTTFKYYDIKGDTAKELKRQMKRKGPNGFWAYARWNVRWSSRCKVSVSIKITMPRWKNMSDGSAALQKKWKRMVTVLRIHELNHGKHGINAAKEIVAKNCKNPKKAIRKWAKQDKLYDKKTAHGRKEGVRL